MKGHAEIVDYLNFLLRGELAARDQYILHSRRYEDLGLNELYERINHEMEEETEHADAILRRILFLEGEPDMRPDPIEPGGTLEEMLRKDLDLEYSVIALCVKHIDYVTRDILVKQQADTEEDHTYWLEKQLRLIEMVGMQNYQQKRMGEDPAHG